MRTICFTLCLFFLTNLSLAQNNSFNGTFFNQQIGLSLSLQSSTNGFSGQYAFQGQSYSVTVQLNGENSLTGTYPYNGIAVPIQLMKLADNYILVTEGVTIPMTFTPSGDKANPLKEETIKIPVKRRSKITKKARGTSFSDVYGGYKFNIPSDWVGRKVENGSYLIGHNTKPGFVLIMAHQYNSLEIMRQESAKGIVEEGMQLLPSTQVTAYGKNGLMADFTGQIQGQAVKAHAIGLLSPNGGGLTMLVAVKTGLYTKEYKEIIQTIANSVAFSKPKSSPVAGQWLQRLKGKRLQYYKTSNGFSTKITIDLCTSGNFGYSSNSSGLSLGGGSTLSYAGQDGGQGTWKITGNGQNGVLILSFHNGEMYEYTLSNRESNGQINLNGRRYFVLNEGACQ